jgi:NAD(P)-dependent dehydrogenase (short-subunit alcohol dehydrogenase family)
MTPRTVWITGAGSGIGRVLARDYAIHGSQVAISGRRPEALRETAVAAPAAIHPFPLDVTDAGAVAETVAAVEAKLGPIDLAVLNAAQYTPMSATHFDQATFRRTIESNVIGVGNALDPLLQRMGARRAGTIAIVASVAGYGGLPKASAYGASKAALINMAEALYPEAARMGVRIVVINPGFVATPMTAVNDFEMPFLISAEAAAARIRRGLRGNGFEIAFPRRFAWLLKLLRLLPYPLYFALTRRMVNDHD